MSALGSVLIIDDDADILLAARFALEPVFEHIDTVSSLDDVEVFVAKNEYDCILLDMNFSPGSRVGSEGLACLDLIRQIDEHVGVILMTAFGGIALAVEGMKRGASDFILKPWRNDALIASLRNTQGRTLSSRRPAQLDDIERDAIASALNNSRGNVAKAASSLGLSRPALYRRLAKYGL